MDKVSGYVEHIVFRNEENGYTVLSLAADNKQDPLTLVGNIPYVSEGEMIEAEGRYTVHASYGEQFAVSTCTVKDPQERAAIERYLGSGAVKGVGQALAARIVRHFQDETFHVIEKEPERLSEVKGISPKKAREIARQIEEKKDMRDAFLFLSRYGISGALAAKIFHEYGTGLYQVIRENPYRMADDITGVGFKIADEIARRAGIEAGSDFRIRSGLYYCLTAAQSEGHCYLPAQELMERTMHLLDLTIEEPDHYLSDLAVERKIAVKIEEGETRVYTMPMYYAEIQTAKMLTDLDLRQKVDQEQVREKIARIERESAQTLDEKQREAVIEAVRCGVLVLTGGPGTGKTTTIRTMIAYFKAEGMQIALAAPTGRAAKRMTEATGYEAKTIHRLLEVEGGTDDDSPAVFAKNAADPLECDVLIIDEMSMVDIFLMRSVLSALTPGTRLILCGDASQLPSVGPGSVLRDIIASDTVSVVRLTKIFRQAEKSDIVVNAHRIHAGEHMVLDNKSRDFFFLERSDANMIISNMIQLITKMLPSYVHASAEEIQVLTPTRKGLLGVERLNRIFQQYLNPPASGKQEHAHADRLFRVGDKVMQTKNNYQLVWEIRGRYGAVAKRGTGVFNGDIGTIVQINPYTEMITVCFDKVRCVDYPFSGLDDLELAYAVTVHKSQGSEYPAVIIPLLGGPKMLMNRNLIYTAVTRARNCVVIVGEKEVFYRMIDNNFEQHRYTALALRLAQAAGMQTGRFPGESER